MFTLAFFILFGVTRKGYGRREKNIGEQKIYQFALNANIQQ